MLCEGFQSRDAELYHKPMNTMVRSAPSAEAVRYPEPCIPMLPTMSLCMRQGPVDCDYASRFLQDDGLFMPSGRAALALALSLSGVGPGDSVLLPAYHCGSMVAPVRWCGAEPRFFSLRPDLSPDSEDLLRRLDTNVKAIVAVHYFGFLTDLSTLRDLCDERGILLLEDCAHALFGPAGQRLPGSTGDYALASTRKFFPGADGGMLVANDAMRPLPALPGTALAAELRSGLGCIQRAADADKLGKLSRPISSGLARVDRFRGRHALRRAAPASEVQARDVRVGADDWFDPAELQHRGRGVSRWLMERSNTARLTAHRRANYIALGQALAGLPGGRPLFAQLPEAVVPYVFPLLLDDPQIRFPQLKHAAVPMYRWEDLSESDCEVSAQYQYRLVQLPCHQELDAAELDWLIDQCRQYLGAPA